MNRAAFLSLIVLLINVISISCKKELSCDNCEVANQSPIARAGADQLISFPVDSVMVDGSTSSDPEGTIKTFSWNQISGPVSAFIKTRDQANTSITSLQIGVYQFELTVTDNRDFNAKDTVRIMVNSAINQPPVANAGADQNIVSPISSVLLNGSASVDPDNNITAYAWSKIAGPPLTNIANAGAVQAEAIGLVQGVYAFELRVTDAGGLISRDTMQVNVTAANLQCALNRREVSLQVIAAGIHPNPRGSMSIATAGNKIFFAGGTIGTYPNFVESAIVDIYDITSNTWSTTQLSIPRYDITSVVAGNKIFFAGGMSGELGDASQTYYSRVDIYDITTNAWTSTSLKYPSNELSAGVVGDKVLFGGGRYYIRNGNVAIWGRSNEVEIYDISADAWSINILSETKTEISVVTLGNKVFFAGGSKFEVGGFNYSDKIDIYDNLSGGWSSGTLSEPKAGPAGITVGNKIYWAGGFNGQALCTVEIKEPVAQATTLNKTSAPGVFQGVLKNDKLVYHYNQKLEIYDVNTSIWSIGLLPPDSPTGFKMMTINNTIYGAGGYKNVGGAFVPSNQIFKIIF